MSYVVNIKTAKRPEAKDIFNEFMKQGEKVVITSDEFPCLKLGTIDKALRGIEINEIENGLEIRICACSSVADYHLFAVAVDILKSMTSSLAYSENDEEITVPLNQLDEDWIYNQMSSSWNTIIALTRQSGTATVMHGLFQPFCVGPKLLTSMDVDLYDSYEKQVSCFERLTNYLVLFQWWMNKASGTQSRLALPDSKQNDLEPLEISLIAIKDNKVNHFDYVSYAPLLAIINMDTNESVIIHFEDFRRVYGVGDHLSGFDELQIRTCCGEPTVEEVKKMMELAKRYVPENLHYRPTFPGTGYDDMQQTFILMWDPEKSDTSLNEHNRNIQQVFRGYFRESIHEWKYARMNDRFYVVKVGDGNTGIVMTGIFGSQPFISPEWQGKGRAKHVIDMKPNMILNPNTVPMLSTADLEQAIPNFMWRGGYSGRRLTEKQARSLEILYAQYLKTIEHMNDGINLCRTRKM